MASKWQHNTTYLKEGEVTKYFLEALSDEDYHLFSDLKCRNAYRCIPYSRFVVFTWLQGKPHDLDYFKVSELRVQDGHIATTLQSESWGEVDLNLTPVRLGDREVMVYLPHTQEIETIVKVHGSGETAPVTGYKLQVKGMYRTDDLVNGADYCMPEREFVRRFKSD